MPAGAQVIGRLFIGFCLLAAGLPAQQAPPEIPKAALERLAHHVGERNVKTEYLGRNGQVVRTTQAVDSAKYAIQDRVVEITSTAEDGSISKVWMFYNTVAKEFCLTSVDARGDLWMLTGGLDEYVITSRKRPNARGGTTVLRFTHTNIQPDSFEASMEMSLDGGETWFQRARQLVTRQ